MFIFLVIIFVLNSEEFRCLSYINCPNKLLSSCKNLLYYIFITLEREAQDIIFVSDNEKVLVFTKKMPEGTKEEIEKISFSNYKKMKMIIKMSLNMNIIEEIPQSAMEKIIIKNKNYSIRVSVHPANSMEILNIRIIKENFFQPNENLKIKKGLNIIAGRTCSGKTTIFYSILNNFQGHIITLEDPVEFILPRLVQTDVEKIGYEEGIKSALRQNPDLIGIGEIRDKTSAQAAVRAALTGHNVLATLHIPNSKEPLKMVKIRMEEMGTIFFQHILSSVIFIDNFQAKQIECLEIL